MGDVYLMNDELTPIVVVSDPARSHPARALRVKAGQTKKTKTERIGDALISLGELPQEELVEAINFLKKRLHEISPFKNEPVDCVLFKLPSRFRSGYFLLIDEQKQQADNIALKYLNLWLTTRGFDAVDLVGAGVSAEVNLY